MTRTASDLNGADLGTRITITNPAWTITGDLLGVDHRVDTVDVTQPGDPAPTCMFGAAMVKVSIGPWSGEVFPTAVVTDADPSTPSLP